MKPEATKTKLTKRDAILDAMLQVVVERGFHEAPMSLISERAHASPGVIYHHFSSKEEILQALYARVCELKHTSLLQGYSPGMPARDAFIHVWMNAYNFYRKHIREMRFLEQYELAFGCPTDQPLSELGQAFQQRFSNQSRGGVLNDWPPEVLNELTIGLVIRFAKLPHKLTPPVLREIAGKMWEIIKAPKI